MIEDLELFYGSGDSGFLLLDMLYFTGLVLLYGSWIPVWLGYDYVNFRSNELKFDDVRRGGPARVMLNTIFRNPIVLSNSWSGKNMWAVAALAISLLSGGTALVVGLALDSIWFRGEFPILGTAVVVAVGTLGLGGLILPIALWHMCRRAGNKIGISAPSWRRFLDRLWLRAACFAGVLPPPVNDAGWMERVLRSDPNGGEHPATVAVSLRYAATDGRSANQISFRRLLKRYGWTVDDLPRLDVLKGLPDGAFEQAERLWHRSLSASRRHAEVSGALEKLTASYDSGLSQSVQEQVSKHLEALVEERRLLASLEFEFAAAATELSLRALDTAICEHFDSAIVGSESESSVEWAKASFTHVERLLEGGLVPHDLEDAWVDVHVRGRGKGWCSGGQVGLSAVASPRNREPSEFLNLWRARSAVVLQRLNDWLAIRRLESMPAVAVHDLLAELEVSRGTLWELDSSALTNVVAQIELADLPEPGLPTALSSLTKSLEALRRVRGPHSS